MRGSETCFKWNFQFVCVPSNWLVLSGVFFFDMEYALLVYIIFQQKLSGIARKLLKIIHIKSVSEGLKRNRI